MAIRPTANENLDLPPDAKLATLARDVFGLEIPGDEIDHHLVAGLLTSKYLGKNCPEGLTNAEYGMRVGMLFIATLDSLHAAKAEASRITSVVNSYMPLLGFDMDTGRFSPEKARQVRAAFMAERGVAELFRSAGYGLPVYHATPAQEHRGVDLVVDMGEDLESLPVPPAIRNPYAYIQIKALDMVREPPNNLIHVVETEEDVDKATKLMYSLTNEPNLQTMLRAQKSFNKLREYSDEQQGVGCVVLVPSPGNDYSWINITTGALVGSAQELRHRRDSLYREIQEKIYHVK